MKFALYGIEVYIRFENIKLNKVQAYYQKLATTYTSKQQI